MIPIPANETARLAAIADIDVQEAMNSEPMAALVNIGNALFDAPVVSVNLIDADWQRVLSSSGLAQRVFDRAISVCAHTIMDDDIFVVPDLRGDDRFAELPYVMGPPGYRFYAGVPLSRAPGLNLGSFCIFDTRLRVMSDRDRANLRDLGTLASSLLGLQQANVTLRANERHLQTAASIDPLTGCLNRAGLQAEVGDLFERAGEPGHGAGLIYIDLDHFKQINDRHGHPAGDTVLREAARRISGGLRKGDLVGRIGGDEFCVVLRNVQTLDDLYRVASRIVNAFRSPIVVRDAMIPCSVSVGASFAPLHATTHEGIVKQADAALYAAKAAGRAQFKIAS